MPKTKIFHAKDELNALIAIALRKERKKEIERRKKKGNRKKKEIKRRKKEKERQQMKEKSKK